jgi:hypothetical protein
MRTVKGLCVLGVLGVVAGGAWTYAQQRMATDLLSPQDYLEIQRLYGHYTRAVDPGSERDASWLYVPDGSFEMRGRKHTGTKELEEFYAGVRKNQSFGVRHFNTNFFIDRTPDGAQATVYMIQVERRDASKPITVSLFGVYHDTLVKTRAGWRFKDRVLVPDGPEDPVSR